MKVISPERAARGQDLQNGGVRVAFEVLRDVEPDPQRAGRGLVDDDVPARQRRGVESYGPREGARKFDEVEPNEQKMIGHLRCPVFAFTALAPQRASAARKPPDDPRYQNRRLSSLVVDHARLARVQAYELSSVSGAWLQRGPLSGLGGGANQCRVG